MKNQFQNSMHEITHRNEMNPSSRIMNPSNKMISSSVRTTQLIQCALFSALIAIGAFIKIPVPVVPFTLQFLFTMLAGVLLGGRLGAISVGIYIALGLIGLPIFAEGGGIWYVMKPSFGYMIGFCVASYVTGKLVEKMKNRTIPRLLGANFIGLLIVYGIGLDYYYVICNFVINSPIAVWPLFLYGFVLAIPGDISLCILAALMTKQLRSVIRKENKR